MTEEIKPIPEFHPEPTDMALFVRHGVAVVSAPENAGGVVPDDFLILVGIAASWHDEAFREAMLRRVNLLVREGALTNLMTSHDGRPN